jgi:hypothetical protein
MKQLDTDIDLLTGTVSQYAMNYYQQNLKPFIQSQGLGRFQLIPYLQLLEIFTIFHQVIKLPVGSILFPKNV